VSRDVLVADLIVGQARQLKMPGLARGFVALARQTREEKWSVEDDLHEVLALEIVSRNESAVRERLERARFPERKTLADFDFAAADGIDRGAIAELARGEWITRRTNVVLAGPIGTGKTHLAIALGIEAARQRRHVAFWRAADLVRVLVEARDSRELGRLQRRLERLDLLILDEVGFVPCDRAGGELLFGVVTARYERRSILVTSNLAFSEWPKVLGNDDKLTAALLDRLTDRAAIITTKGKSFRMRRRNQAATPDPEAAEPAAPWPTPKPR